MGQIENAHYTRRVTVRFQPDEYKELKAKWEATTCQKLSDYIRKVLLSKPVVVTYRNRSADAFLSEMIQLKNELHAIGNNFNQSVRRLNAMSNVAEIKTWALLNEASKKSLMQKVEEIKLRMNQLYDQWLQK